MGARTLQARLTGRLVALAGVVLVAVGMAAVAVTDRVLDASDSAAARASAAAALDAIGRELAEGDGPQEAVDEVVTAERAEGVRLTVRGATRAERSSDAPLPDLAPGRCTTAPDAEGRPWRACGAGDARAMVVAAILIAAHRAAVGALARGMIAVVAIAILALWLAVRRALRAPLAELDALVGWTTRILRAEQAVEPPPSRTREIAQLETAFDTLVRRLLDALARERANSAHIAHELRTPLTAMIAELDAVPAADDRSRAAIARVRADAARLADVIEAILVLSAGRPRARAEAVVNVADVARELAPAGASVDAPDEALIEGDERLVALALRNLVDNARKYGAGVSRVRVSREGDGVSVAVVDQGPGLDEASRARMFDRYWCGSADGEGRGLGLALVRAVAERHGGRAEARPGPGGKGLDVSVTFAPLVGWHEQEPVAR